MLFHNTPIAPKKPGPLQVLTIGRVSTLHQDIGMLDVQKAEVEKSIRSVYDGPMNMIELGEQVSGEEALRESYIDACELIESGDVDVAILFDLSKAGRLPRFMHQFIDICVDCDARFISVGDNIDTADENWEIAAGAATLVHGTHNRYTRHRIKAKGDHAFLNGGMVTKVAFGFRKLSKDESESGQFGPKGLLIAMIPEATPVIRKIKDRVMQGNSYESIAEWLNDEIVGLAWCTREHFTGKYVAGYLRSTTLLHGERQRSRHQVIRLRTTGRKKRKLNPNPLTKTYLELAHLTPEEHAELIAEMDRRVMEHPRKRRAKVGPKGRARSRSHFPGQAMTCNICGSLYYWCGAGGLKCSNCGDPAKGSCWNHLQADPLVIRRKVLDVLLNCIQERPDAKTTLIQAALAECERLRGHGGREQARLEEQIKRLKSGKRALATAIRKGGEVDVLLEELHDAEANLAKKTQELKRVREQAEAELVPADANTVREQLPEIVAYLMADSYEFADLLRRAIPVFRIEPLQAVDTGRPVPRAHVTFSFAALLERRPSPEYTPQPGDFSVVLDLFEPPAHIQCLRDAVRLHREHPNWSAERIAEAIGPDVKRWSVRLALKLHEQMEELGVTEPYVPVTDPAKVSRWRMTNAHEARWNQAK